MSRARLRTAAGLAALVLAAAAQTPALAATTRPARAPRVVVATTPMVVVGFDAAVARAHGYVIRTDAAGRQYAVRSSARGLAASTPTPENTVRGNCGSSYISLSQNWNYAEPTWDEDTGFTVIHDAVDYHWSTTTTTSGGDGTFHFEQEWGGGLWFDSSWHGHHRESTEGQYGDTHAKVDTGSFAELDTGAICYSYGPTAYLYLY